MRGKKTVLMASFVVLYSLASALSFSQPTHRDSVNYDFALQINTEIGVTTESLASFIAKDQQGKLITNKDLNSKITFVNFWFESCAPCLAEFQALEKLYNKNKSRRNFQFISFTYEEDTLIEKIRQKHNLSYPIYRLSIDSSRKLLGRAGYPTSLIIDKKQKIVYSLSGGSTDPDEVDKIINYFVQAELDKLIENN